VWGGQAINDLMTQQILYARSPLRVLFHAESGLLHDAYHGASREVMIERMGELDLSLVLSESGSAVSISVANVLEAQIHTRRTASSVKPTRLTQGVDDPPSTTSND